ncbi:MAG: hypothetical protein KBG28_02500 [Kofleriaceae bacterium]|nr:hypothetical protein [Kofleriaceae bacterium]MBP6837747.1 hypothetical protein [Kofleriaceae bacterium]MBP9202827.1 hypothetical protein [Kofleriaceae bacterium]
MRLLPHVSVALLVASFVGACGEVALRPDAGGGDDGGGADAPPAGPCTGVIAPENVFACLNQSLCALIERCGLGEMGDTTCDELPFQFSQDFAGLGSDDLLAELLAAGRVNYDGAEAGQCVAQMATVACKTVLLNEATLFDGVCGSVVTGTVGNGSRCQFDSECGSPVAVCVAAGTTCASDGQQALGACQDAVAVGQSCENLPCRPGDHCVGTSPNKVCRPGDAAAPCNDDQDCDSALHCNAGQCRADVPAGATCRNPSQCAGDNDCVIPVGMTNGTCQPAATVDAACTTGCWGADRMRCFRPAPMQAGTCQPLPTEGMACADLNDCGSGGFGLVCDALTCQTPGDLGELCDVSNSCNLGLYCSRDVTGAATGSCSAPQPLGSQCNDDRQCATGACSANVAGLCVEPTVCTL